MNDKVDFLLQSEMSMPWNWHTDVTIGVDVDFSGRWDNAQTCTCYVLNNALPLRRFLKMHNMEKEES